MCLVLPHAVGGVTVPTACPQQQWVTVLVVVKNPVQVYKPVCWLQGLDRCVLMPAVCAVMTIQWPCQSAALQASQQQGSSALLACLERLDEAAWAEVLLEKLIAAKAAGNLAATCTRLRQLVHGSSRGPLDFAPLAAHSNPRQVEEWTAALPDHFPSCQTARLVNSCENSYLVCQALAPALAR